MEKSTWQKPEIEEVSVSSEIASYTSGMEGEPSEPQPLSKKLS